MPTCVPGEVFVFQVLYVDGNSQPVTVNTPMIDVYRFDDSGAKVSYVSGGTMSAVDGDLGRFVYPFVTPQALNAGAAIYAKITAVNSLTADQYLTEIAVDLIPAPVTVTCPGLIAQFIRS